MKTMTAPVRDRPQIRQARQSILQLSERLNDFGWLMTVPSQDLGEDLLVHIQFEGRGTGIYFSVQVKSVTNLNQRRTNNYIPYDVKVKNLLRWEQFDVPLIFIIWDVKLREGRWLILPKAIEELDTTDPHWRHQTTKRLRIPWSNTTGNRGLIRLRHALGYFLYPLISRGKKLEIQIKPENGSNSKPNWLLNPLASEARYLVIGKKDVQVSEWWNRWFNETIPENIVLPLPNLKPTTRLIRLEITDGEGFSVTSPPLTIEFSSISKDESFFTSQQDTGPLRLRLRVTQNEWETSSYHLSLKPTGHFGKHVCETHDLFCFLDAVSNGGNLKFIFEPDNETWLEIKLPPEPSYHIPPETLNRLENLCFIQKWTGHQFRLPNNGIIPEQDIKACDKLVGIRTRGVALSEFSILQLTVEGEDLSKLLRDTQPGELLRFTKSFDTSTENLLGQAINLGRQVMFLSGFFENFEAIPHQKPIPISDGQTIIFNLREVERIDLYPDIFIQEAHRLAQILGSAFAIERVYLFGSLAWGHDFNPKTDIDLAVSGLLPESFFEAVGYLEQKTTFPFNLLALETASDNLHSQILSSGKLLYEQKINPVSSTSNGSSY